MEVVGESVAHRGEWPGASDPEQALAHRSGAPERASKVTGRHLFARAQSARRMPCARAPVLCTVTRARGPASGRSSHRVQIPLEALTREGQLITRLSNGRFGSELLCGPGRSTSSVVFALDVV